MMDRETVVDFDGSLISELGVKRYLFGWNNLKTSNINYFKRGDALIREWEKCNFGCHGPSYRTLKRTVVWRDVLDTLDKIDPFVAGVADGIHHKTVFEIELLGEGVERTAEGLYLKGGKVVQTVGDENWAAANLVKIVFQKILQFDFDVIENPLMQVIVVLVNEYISVIPEWVIDEMLAEGALHFPEGIDRSLILKAVQHGLIEVAEVQDIDKAIGFLEGKAKRVIGKQVGKRLWGIIAGIIAARITIKLMTHSVDVMRIKRRLVSLRKIARTAKGGPGTMLYSLLKAQGFLGYAARASRSLKQDCPRVWDILRHKLHGSDMVFFLVQPMVQEYVDRLSLIEKNPAEFLKVMTALIKDHQTSEIFYPKAY